MVIIIQGLLDRFRLSNVFIMRVNMMPRGQRGPKLLLDIGQDLVGAHFFKQEITSEGKLVLERKQGKN